MELVVCDDDPGVRRIVADIAGSLGLRVLGATDAPGEAVELVDRFGAGLLVLDLSLPYGDGLDALRALRERGSPCRVVVFSSYAFDPDRILRAGADAVIDKLHFDELEETLLRLGHVDRRAPRLDRAWPEPVEAVSPRGLEPPASFEAALDAARAGDVVAVLELDGRTALVASWGELAASDLLVELGGQMRRALRQADRICGAGPHRIEVLLLGSAPTGMRALFDRVRFAWETTDPLPHFHHLGRPTFSAASAVVAPGELAREALARAGAALEAGHAAGRGQLWAAS